MIRRLLHPRPLLQLAVGTVIWALLAVALGLAFFLGSSRSTVVASHDVDLRPNLSGQAVVHTGPLLPDVRLATDGPVGVEMWLGKTQTASTDELLQRYAFLASQPEGTIVKVTDTLTDMALSALLRGGALALLPVGVWLLVGPRRRRELRDRLPRGRTLVVAGSVLLAGVLVWQPWQRLDPQVQDEAAWMALDDFLGGAVPVPQEARALEVLADPTAVQSRRLIESAVSTYQSSKDFYAQAAEEAADLELRVPEEGDTVAVLVSDRHDNIGMDPVARAIGDAGGATLVLNAGDDTSNGATWEAFSLDSVSEAFEGYDRFAVAGNHDNGTFVRGYLADRGWTMVHDAEGALVEGPDDITLLGVDDPRASGLGNWRDEPGLTFAEVEALLADAACEARDAGQRASTVLVHDANLGRELLERGCADLVVGGHLHVRRGPDQVVAEDGTIGYSYTNGTTGGAAYAIAVGSKPRRPAEVTLVTYAEGRPVGIQPVLLQTDGSFEVSEYVELDLESPVVAPE